MNKYSSYSTCDLERMCKAVQAAFMALDCPGRIPCSKCCIRKDCQTLNRIKGNIYAEIYKRRVKGGWA